MKKEDNSFNVCTTDVRLGGIGREREREGGGSAREREEREEREGERGRGGREDVVIYEKGG